MVSTPSPPDPQQTADKQGQYNVQAALAQQGLNMVNQITPYGTLEYAPTSGKPIDSHGGLGGAYPGMYTAYTKLNPGLQRLYIQDVKNARQSAQIANALQSNVMQTASQPLDLSWGATEAKLAELNRQTLDPQWTQRREQLDQQLYNRAKAPVN
jgi:hypothetical protein